MRFSNYPGIPTAAPGDIRADPYRSRAYDQPLQLMPIFPRFMSRVDIHSAVSRFWSSRDPIRR